MILIPWHPRFNFQVGTAGSRLPGLFAKAIDALNAKELRTLLKAAVDGIKAVDAKSSKAEGRNVYFFQSYEDARAQVAQLRDEVARFKKRIEAISLKESRLFKFYDTCLKRKT